MAKGPVKYSEFFEDDGAIERLIESLEQLEKDIISSAKKLKGKLRVTDPDDADAMEKLRLEVEKLQKSQEALKDSLKKANKVNNEANRLKEEEKKLTDKLNNATSEQATTNAKLKLELARVNKETKEQAKEQAGLTSTYQRQSKKLNELRKRYKDLFLEGKAGTEDTKALKLQIDELDTTLKAADASVGQFQRNVGDYKNAMKEAAEETGAFAQANIGAIDTTGELGEITEKLNTIYLGLSKVYEVVTKDTDDLSDAEKKATVETKALTVAQRFLSGATRKTAKSMRVLKVAIAATGIGALLLLLTAMGTALAKTQAGLDSMRGALNRFGAVMDVIISRLGNLGLALFDLWQLQKALITLDFDKVADEWASSMDRFAKAGDGLSTAFSDAIDNADKLTKLQKEQINLNLELRKSIAELSKEEQKFQSLTDDATNSLAQREDFNRKAGAASKQRAEEQLELAQKELDIINAQIKTSEENGNITDAQKEQRLEGILQVIEAETELQNVVLENQREQNQLLQDVIEQNLDILIDGFDNQKSINERIISDERLLFSRRRALLKETEKLGNDSFARQIEEIERSKDIQIDANDLIATSDAVLLNQKVKGLGLSEIISTRLLEVIRDRRTATQDLIEANRDLNEQELKLKTKLAQATQDLQIESIQDAERRQTEAARVRAERRTEEAEDEFKSFEERAELIKLIEQELQNELNQIRIDSFEKGNEEALKVIETDLLNSGEKQIDIAKDILDKKIDFLEEEIALREKLNQKTIDQELELAKLRRKQADEEKKIQAAKRKDIEDTFLLAGNHIIKQLEAEEDRIEDELTANEKQIDKQAELAAEGLENTLAFEQAEAAALESERQKQLEQIKKAEKIKALYAAYQSYSSRGDDQAVAKTLRDFAILQGIEASFGDGGIVNDVLNQGSSNGGVSNGLVRGDSHRAASGGVPILVEGNEGIFSTNEMANLGKENFYALKGQLKRGSIGTDFFNGQSNSFISMPRISDNSGVEREVRDLRQLIASRPEASLEPVIDTVRGIMEIDHVSHYGNKKVIDKNTIKRI